MSGTLYNRFIPLWYGTAEQALQKCYTVTSNLIQVEAATSMSRSTALRAILAILIFVLGNLQAWDSNVADAGLLVVLLVSFAIPLPAVALLVPIKQPFLVGALVVSLILLLAARLLSPVPLPGLFIILVPAAMGLIFAGLINQEE